MKQVIAAIIGFSLLCAYGNADTITGKINRTDGQGVVGASVNVIADPGGKNTAVKTGSDGTFTMRNLATGYYRVEIRKDGFCNEDIYRIEVNEPKYGVKNFTFSVYRPGSITGFVYDEQGKPIAGAKVANTAKTDARGFYHLTGLRPGGAFVPVEAPPFIRAQKENVLVVEGKETGGVNFTLSSGGSITGSVLDKATQKPLKEVWVNAEGKTYQSAKTDAGGKFTLAGLLPGTYKISSYVQGYEGGQAGNIEVKKGETAAVAPLALPLRDRSFSLQTRNWVFTPGQKVCLRFNAFRVSRVKVSVYPSGVLALAGMGRDGGPRSLVAGEPDATKRVPPVAVTEIPISYPKPLSDVYDRKMYIDPLPAGAYLVVLKPEDLPEQQSRILVTDLGLVAKKSENMILVHACDLISGEPRPDVALRFFDPQAKEIGSGRTDREGNFTGTTAPARIIGQAGSSLAVFGYWSNGDSVPDKNKVYIYTERPAYRPNQTVYFKGILRRENGSNYDIPTISTCAVEINGPDGNLFHRTTCKVNERGSFDGSFPLPDEPDLGTYTIQANSYSPQGQFLVLEYRKPEYSVEATTDKKRYLPKEKIRVLVQARYYFGAPVTDADVSYSVYEKQVWDEDEEDYDYEDYGWGYGSFISSGTARVDEKGQAILEIPVKESYDHDVRYTVEVTVTDQSKREVKSTAWALVTQGDFKIVLATDKYVYSPGEEVPVCITIKDYDGRPRNGEPIVLRVAQETYKKKKYSYKELLSQRLTAGPDGTITVKVRPTAQGYLRVYAQGTDAYKNLITGSRYIWVAGNDYYAEWYGKKELDIVTDKKRYEPGETARILINASQPNLTVLFTLEGYGLFERRVIKMKGVTHVLEVPLKKEYIPSVYAAAAAVKDKKYLSAERHIAVSPAERLLNVAVTSDKDKYQPGETATYRIRTTDAGNRPRPAEFSFGLVDEAIYAVAPEQVEKIEDFFYGKKPNRVATGYSFYEWAYGGAMKDLAAEDIRKNFKDTAFWQPYVLTDAAGNATVSVRLPDNLTTWRATTRAVTADTAVGTGIDKIVSAKPLIARLATPRFFVEDDRLTIGGIVHNYTERDQTVTVSLKASGLDLLEPAAQTLVIKPQGSGRADWKVKVAALSPAIVTLSARGQDVSDGLELTIPVYPYGTLESETAAGECPDKSVDTLTLSAGAVPSTIRCLSYLYPSLASGLFHNLDYLAGYPYGCVEQTLNRFLPCLYVSKALRDLGLTDLSFLAANASDFAQMQGKLPDMVGKGLARIYRYQHDDGGWGWWEHDASHPYTSAYVVFGLAEAKKAGYQVDEDRLNRGRDFLKNALGTVTDNDLKTFITFSLAWADKLPAGTCYELYQARATLSPYSQALLALTLNDVSKQKAADVLADLYKNIAALSPFVSYWKNSRPGWYSWTDSDIEATAWGLKATLAIDPARPEVPKILRYLVQMRRGYSWRSTKDTAVCVFALTDFLRNSRELSPDYTAVLTVNDRKSAEQKITRDTLKQFVTTVRTPPEVLKPGANTFALTKQGSGALYYTHTLDYFARDVSIPAKDKGFRIEREYKREAGDKLEDITGPVKIGDRIRVRLTITGKNNYEYLAIEDYLPSGFEVVEDKEPDEWGWWYCRREVRDEKVAFFTPQFGEDKREIVYYIRPEAAGTYHVLPAKAYLMYFPEVWGRSAEYLIKVAAK